MTELIDGRGDTARRHIMCAAARQFAVMPYSQVSLDGILTSANEKKSALYGLFGSKLSLATVLVEHQLAMTGAGTYGRIAGEFGGLEALIDFSYAIAAADMCDHRTRAAFNLLESIGRFDGLQTRVVDDWIRSFAAVASRGISLGDVRTDCDSEQLARLLTSLYLGVRQTSDLDSAERFIGDFEAVLLLALPGFANPDRLPYLTGFIKRRSTLTIRNAAPMAIDKL